MMPSAGALQGRGWATKESDEIASLANLGLTKYTKVFPFPKPLGSTRAQRQTTQFGDKCLSQESTNPPSCGKLFETH